MNTGTFTADSLVAYRQEDLYIASQKSRQVRVSIVAGPYRSGNRFADTFNALRTRLSVAVRRTSQSTPLTAGN